MRYASLPNYLILIIAFGLILSGCSDSSTDAGTSDTAIIQGFVASENTTMNTSPQNVEGTVVSAASINAEGEFEAISGTSVEADANGSFTLEVDVNTASHISIVAETEAGVRSGFLPRSIENGQTYTLQPLSVESSGKTEVYARLVANGNAEIVHKADVEASISADMAVQAESSSNVASRLATGLSNMAEARSSFYSEFGGSSSSENLDSAIELRAQALAELESSLASATSESQIESAVQTYLEVSTQAYTDAGFDMTASGKMMHMKKNVMLNSSTSLSSEVRNEIRARAAYKASIAIDSATQAEANAAGMSSSTIDAIATAGGNLQAEVRTSSGSSSDVSAAFETYHEEVLTAVENDSSTEAAIIVAIDTEINATGGPKTIFNSALSGVVDASVLVELYGVFSTSVKNTTAAQLSGFSESEAEAMGRLMLLINLGS